MFKRPRLIDSGVLFVYTLISIVMTWPVTANLRGGYTLFGSPDEYMFVWGFWWMHYSLADLHTWPYHTNMLYYPFGTGLAFHTDTPLITLLFSPITGASGPAVAYNLAILVSFIFSAFSMYLLVNYLVRDKRAAFFGGIVFAFSTFKFMQAAGHIHIVSTEFFPIYVLFFILMLREPAHRHRYALFAGLSLGFVFLIDYYQTVYAMFFSICYLTYYLFGKAGANPPANGEPSPTPAPVEAATAGEAQLTSTDELPYLAPPPSAVHGLTTIGTRPASRGSLRLFAGRRLFNRKVVLSTVGLLAILGVVFLIIGSPLLYADYSDITNGYYVKWGGEDIFYADMAGFFVPYTPLLSNYVVAHLNALIIGPAGPEAVVYAGWAVIILVAIGTLRLTRRLIGFRFWLVFILICYVFALGPQPHFLGTALPIPGPYALWAQIPLLNNARIPSRFDLLITFAGGILVAYTIRDLLTSIPQRWPRIKQGALAIAFLVLLTPLMLLENLVMPLATQGYHLQEPTAAFAQIAADPSDGAVLDLPLDGANIHDSIEHIMYEQTLHQKFAFSGSISRPLPEFNQYYGNDEYISLFDTDPTGKAKGGDQIEQVLTNTKAMNFYRHDAAQLAYYLDVHYIIAHPASMPLKALQFLSETLPLEQLNPQNAATGNEVVYRIRTDLIAPLVETNTIQLGGKGAAIFRLMGWYEPYTDQAGGFNFAWLGTASGQLLTTVRDPADYTVAVQLQPMIVNNRPQTLTIYANDETSPVATFQLSKYEWQQRSFVISREHWRSGINTLHLTMTYATKPGNGDNRSYSLGVRSISFIAK